MLKTVYLAKEIDKSIFAQIASSGAKVVKVDAKKAQALAHGGNHQGFLAEVEDFEFASFGDIKKLDKIVLLYGISDVGNIGAIARTAYALGADALVVAAKNIAIEGVIRASSGAAYELPIALVADPLSALNELKQVGFQIYAAAAGGNEVKAKFEGRNVLIMGSEGEGIPRKALEKCNEVLGIKMRKNWDSLNVSVAFGILFDRMING